MAERPHADDGGDGDDRSRLAEAIRSLLEARSAGATICPSEAARAVGGGSWRALMPAARDVARSLAVEGVIEITQGGSPVDPEVEWRGPVRLGRRRDRGQSCSDSTCPTEGELRPSSTSR